MTTLPPQTVPANDQLASHDLFQIFWRGKIPLIVITFLVTLAVTVAALMLPAKYEATVVLMPVPESESEDKLGSMGGSASLGGGLASLAGLTGTGNTLKTEAMAILDSQALTVRYIRENNLLPVLYQSKWDPVAMKWKTNSPAEIPTLWKANRYFRGLRTISDNLKTGLITLTITWRDPEQAAKWANDLVSMTNEYLRGRAVDEAQRNIDFLEEEAKKSGLLSVSLQQATAALTETQLQKIMLARSRAEYALKVMDPATVAERKSFPLPAIWIPAGFFGGLFLAVLFVLLRASGTPAPVPWSNESANAKRPV